MNKKIDPGLLEKYTKGNYSRKDFKEISAWFQDKDFKHDLKSSMQQHWNNLAVEDQDEKDLSSILYYISQSIRKTKSIPTIIYRLRNFYVRTAAVLLLPLLLYGFYATFFSTGPVESHSKIEIFSPPGARTHFQLPDGTDGWLNGGSSIKYASNFRQSRDLQLTGEAWFDVVHNPQKPFTISTAKIKIQVLGTKFNVCAFNDDASEEVVLQEGKIKLSDAENKLSLEMKPNERFFLDKQTGESTMQTVNALQYSAWKDGLLVFRNDPLADVLKRIGRWYNVNIEIKDLDLAKFRYRATFHDEQVEEVIRLISMTVPIEYTIDNRETDENGTFRKRSITIRKKTN